MIGDWGLGQGEFYLRKTLVRAGFVVNSFVVNTYLSTKPAPTTQNFPSTQSPVTKNHCSSATVPLDCVWLIDWSWNGNRSKSAGTPS